MGISPCSLGLQLQLLDLPSSCWAFDDRASRVSILGDAMLEVPVPVEAATLKPMLGEVEALVGDVESKRRVG